MCRLKNPDVDFSELVATIELVISAKKLDKKPRTYEERRNLAPRDTTISSTKDSLPSEKRSVDVVPKKPVSVEC